MFFNKRQNPAYDIAYGEAEGMVKSIANDFIDNAIFGRVEIHQGNMKEFNKDLQKFMQSQIYEFADLMNIKFKFRDIMSLIETGMREVRLTANSYAVKNKTDNY